MEEFEIKFLDINVEKLEEKLVSIGAVKVGIYEYQRALFDYPDFRLDAANSWIRLRTNGTETTLTYKERLGVTAQDGSASDEGMKEIEVVVDSFEKTYELLKSIGLVIKREEKNRRVRYEKGTHVFDIDFWPGIPPYVEVESTSLAEAENAAREAGFEPKDGLVCSPKQVYKKYGIDVGDYTYLSFEKMVKSNIAD